MPVTISALTSDIDSTNATVYTTASVTPTANRLVLILIHCRSDEATQADPTSVAGNGLTWVKVNSVKYKVGVNEDRSIWVYRALGASPSAGSIVITFPTTKFDCHWSVVEFADVDTGGTNGSVAVVQSVTNAGAGTTPSVTLAAFGSVDNATYGAFGAGNATVNLFAAGAGFAEIHEVNGQSSSIMSEWRNDNDTSVNATISVSIAWGGIAIEIKYAVAAAGVTGPIFIM